MGASTHIQWTDSTWNPVTGCSVVSAGCRHCYAMRLAGGRLGHHPSRAGLTRATSAGPVWTGEVRLNGGWLDQPLRWRSPRRIFVCAHGDLFHPAVPDAWIDRVFGIMALAGQHTFHVLTKRPERALEWMRNGQSTDVVLYHWKVGPDSPTTWPLGNVWLGVSVEDQETADARIPLLLETPAAVRFISAEPLLGEIRFDGLFANPGDCRDGTNALEVLDWVIVGGESGPRARPCELNWIRSIVEQCLTARTAYFIKQLGANPIVYYDDANQIVANGGRVVWDDSGECVSARLVLRSRAGSDPTEWPADLSIRQFPQ